MSKELEIYQSKDKWAMGRLAGTLHPNDSASQMSSNVNYKEGQEAGGDAAQRIATARVRQGDETRSGVSTNSRALVTQGNSSRLGSSMSRHSSARGSGLQIEDITSVISSATGGRSAMTTNSKAIVPANRTLEAVAGSSISRASSAQQSSTSNESSARSSGSNGIASSSSVSKAKGTQSSATKHLAIQAAPSQISAAKSSRSTASIPSATDSNKSSISSTSKTSSIPSQRSTASSARSGSAISSSSKGPSRTSGQSRALVPTGQALVRASPLRNEVSADDLNDDMYSISIHERGPMQNVPNRADMLKIIMKENPHLHIDEATVIADNHIATLSSVGRSQIGGYVAPATIISKANNSSVSKASSSRAQDIIRSSAPSIMSAASSSRTKASVPSPLARSRTAPASTSNELVISSPSTALSTFQLPGYGSETNNSDLLALSQIRQQGDLKRAQAMQTLQSQLDSVGASQSSKRLLELELAKQSLADVQLQSQMQELAIGKHKLEDLARHAHEDRLAALDRASDAENNRKHSALIDAVHERTQLEKARNRERRGDIAQHERRRDDERTTQVQKDYERMDHDQVMEKIDAFGRLSEANRPRDRAQPRRSGVDMASSYNYRNSRTGGDGSVKFRTHQGCNRSGDGLCPHCGFEYTEHPVKKQKDGSLITRSGKRVSLGAGHGGSEVSKGSKSRK